MSFNKLVAVIWVCIAAVLGVVAVQVARVNEVAEQHAPAVVAACMAGPCTAPMTRRWNGQSCFCEAP